MNKNIVWYNMIFNGIDSMILYVYICVCDTISKRKKKSKSCNVLWPTSLNHMGLIHICSPSLGKWSSLSTWHPKVNLPPTPALMKINRQLPYFASWWFHLVPRKLVIGDQWWSSSQVRTEDAKHWKHQGIATPCLLILSSCLIAFVRRLARTDELYVQYL